MADELRRDGATDLVFGRSPQNFLAGIPDELPDAYVDVLESVGFELGDAVYGLERSINGYALPDPRRST